MRKFLFFVFSSLLFISSCKESTIKISGKINNHSSKLLYLEYNNTEDTIKINENGEFYHTIKMNNPAYAFLYAKRSNINLYLEPSHDINIVFDERNTLANPTFSGDGKKINDYLKLQGNIIVGYKLYKKNSSQFVKQIEKTKKIKLNLIKGLNRKFANLEKSRIKYLIANCYYNYPLYHRYYSNSKKTSIPDNFYDFEKTLKIDDPNFLFLESYKKFVKCFLDRKLNEFDNEINDKNKIKLQIILAEKYFKSLEVLDYLKYIVIRNHVQRFGIKNIKPIIEEFVSNSLNKKYIDHIIKIKNSWEKIEKGNIAPEFSFPNFNGDTINLKQFKNKRVYIHIWNFWSERKSKSLSKYNKLIKENKQNDIVFINICSYNNKRKWKKFIEKNNIKGESLIAKYGNSFFKKFKVINFPRNIYIGKEGIILNNNINDIETYKIIE